MSDGTKTPIFYLKARKKGKAAYWFVGSGGSMTRLRVHAICFTERQYALDALRQFSADNPKYDFVVRASR